MDVLREIDQLLEDMTVSPDAMRWSPDPVPPDLRPAPTRAASPARQARWAWWCPTCARPLPGPHWSAPAGTPGTFAYHVLDGREGVHVIDLRTAG